MKAKNRIKVVLAEKNVRANALKEHLRVSKTSVSNWCNNRNQPTLEHMYEIAEYLNVPVCELLVQNEITTNGKD